jgi:signal transduction histidine kinase
MLNAGDAMELGGVLAVRTEDTAGLVRVIVADSGAGIAHDNLTRIFDPFFTTKAARKGTGLGLSVSYGIVREHGGEIEVESELGTGTRFHLSFPAASAPKKVEAARLETPASAPAAAVSTQVSTAVVTSAGAVAQSDRLIQ